MESALTKTELDTPIYDSESAISITSLSKVYHGSTVVYHDEAIGHLQTVEIEDISTYYDEQYQFFDQSDEDDIVYKIVDGQKVYRQQHQVETLLRKVDFSEPLKVLDYGCAKGTVMKRLAAEKASVTPYLFDVSDAYSPLWDKFLTSEQYASYEVKTEWNGMFDLVTSFFALEHTADPLLELRTIKGLLKDEGLVYLIVPNVFANTGDFIVVDHVHHYSEASLTYMLSQVGFEVMEIDAESHFAAFIVVGRKTSSSTLAFEYPVDELENINGKIQDIALFWREAKQRIKAFETENSGSISAIYGAGVYGNYIYSCLESAEQCVAFLDQNPLLIGAETMDKPILHPDDLPAEVEAVYVGLNPLISRDAIGSIESWKNKTLTKMFI